MLKRLWDDVRVRLRARRFWCAFCGEAPRVELAGGDNRYCSQQCQALDAEMQAHG